MRFLEADEIRLRKRKCVTNLPRVALTNCPCLAETAILTLVFPTTLSLAHS